MGIDYTVLALGERLEDGEIEVCPHCGKNGLARQESGKMFWNHYLGGAEDNNRVTMFPMDYCPKPLPREA
jgi:hypothetical protein